jgi:hypothetical protein
MSTVTHPFDHYMFDKNTTIFAGFHGPRGWVYLAKWQGYVARGFSKSFLALFSPFLRTGIKTSSFVLNDSHNPDLGKVIWRSG